MILLPQLRTNAPAPWMPTARRTIDAPLPDERIGLLPVTTFPTGKR